MQNNPVNWKERRGTQVSTTKRGYVLLMYTCHTEKHQISKTLRLKRPLEKKLKTKNWRFTEIGFCNPRRVKCDSALVVTSAANMGEKLLAKSCCILFQSWCNHEVGPSPLTQIIYFNESSLKMMKNVFYLFLKALFVLKIFKFLPWLLVM